jgi:hypothetical protein
MINSVFVKLIEGIMEEKVNKWAENKGKRAKRKVGFHLKLFTIDHCLTLRYIMQKTWDDEGEEYGVVLSILERPLTLSREINYW